MTDKHPLLVDLFSEYTQGESRFREQYKDGPFKGAWREAVYSLAYAYAIDNHSLTPIEKIHRDGNPDWRMGYEDGRMDLAVYEGRVLIG